MALTINRLVTSNTRPTVTGTITEFQRIDPDTLEAKQKLSVTVNYKRYDLFAGNLGLDETVTPNVWKLQFDTDLFPGFYDVEVTVSDVATAAVVQTKKETGILQITRPSDEELAAADPSITQQIAKVQALMGLVNSLFGGSNGVGGNPSVHPTTHDDSSTSLLARGGKERKKDPRVKSKKKRAANTKVPTTPKKYPMYSVSPDNAEDLSDSDAERIDEIMDKVKEASDKQMMDYYGGS